MSIRLIKLKEGTEMVNKKEVKTKEIKFTPVISEKSYALANAFNKYTFLTPVTIGKIELAKEVEKKYKVKVLRVNSVIKPGKMKVDWKSGKKFRKTDSKKIIVTLKKGNKIDEFFDI